VNWGVFVGYMYLGPFTKGSLYLTNAEINNHGVTVVLRHVSGTGEVLADPRPSPDNSMQPLDLVRLTASINEHQLALLTRGTVGSLLEGVVIHRYACDDWNGELPAILSVAIADSASPAVEVFLNPVAPNHVVYPHVKQIL
jgi:hypothetical protein